MRASPRRMTRRKAILRDLIECNAPDVVIANASLLVARTHYGGRWKIVRHWITWDLEMSVEHFRLKWQILKGRLHGRTVSEILFDDDEPL